jgi:ketosteroid isomerase-like protein
MRISATSPLFILPVLVGFTLFATAQEPVKPKLTPRIITATRQVTMFSALEHQMLSAVKKKDRTGLEAMLTEDCQILMPDADPLPSQDWVDSVMDKDFSLKSSLVKQMFAIDLGDTAIVNYERVQEATFRGKAGNGEFFVVDLWKKSGDSWKLANRYVAKISSAMPAPKGPVRPTGKQ